MMPAIDILGGNCVRLTQGDFASATIYGNNPVEVAKEFEKQGAQCLHVVDLDGARLGFPVNMEIILAVAQSVAIPLQVGGGIRSYGHASTYLENGVKKIILSTVAIESPKLLECLLKNFGSTRIAVSIDSKDGKVATRGWLRKTTKTVSDSIDVLKRVGVTSVIVTDISKDGLLKGPNFGLAEQFISAGFETIASGGVSSLWDIEEFQKRGACGVIIGKAIYEGKVNLCSAIKRAEYKNNLAKRIIPCLDVKNGRVVKGAHFRNVRPAGDPVYLGKRYSESGADELVFLDIAATLDGRKIFCEMVSKIAKEISIPFTVGGGVSTLEDIKTLLASGADKVSIGSSAVTDARVVKRAAEYFGSQCIVVSVDAKKQKQGWKVYIKGGSEDTGINAIEFCACMEQCGAGELLVNSLDRDGTKKGFDLELLRAITKRVHIPVIASSGAGKAEDFLDVFQNTPVDAALGASIFHFCEISIRELKIFLLSKNIPMRL